MLTRRNFLATGACLLGSSLPAISRGQQTNPKRLAIVTTLWNYRSHAWHMAERFLHGYPREGKWHRPPLTVVSAYVDQQPDGDLSKRRAEEFGFKIYPTVAEALRCGGDKLAVDAVLQIGEHGNYPVNEIGQKQYPRYELFSQIVKVFKADGRTTPIFNDKHLSWKFEWAKEMVDTAHAMNFPLLAGSSLPVTWRMPAIDLPYGAEVEEVLGVAFGAVDIYDFHALEMMQCMAERRKGGESGVVAMHALRGDAVWDALGAGSFSAGGFSPRLFEACLSRSQTLAQDEISSHRYPTLQQMKQWVKQPVAYRFEYADGLKATMLQLNGLVKDFTFAAKLKGEAEPLSTLFYLPDNPNVVYSAALMSKAEEMFLTGRAPYPAERTLLTSGLVAAAMQSLATGQKRLETAHLAIRYQAPRIAILADLSGADILVCHTCQVGQDNGSTASPIVNARLLPDNPRLDWYRNFAGQRSMKIHEYQAKELFKKGGVAVLRGKVAATPEEAAAAFKELGSPLAVVKAQIHAGGRGKGTIIDNPQQRGVQLVRSADEAAKVAKNLLGHKLVTIQSGAEGKTVNRVFVEEGCKIARELYLGIVLDRAAAKPVLMVSSEGGVEIEKVAAETPHLIYKEHFDPHAGLMPYQVRKLCYRLNLKGPSVASAEKFMRALCRMYVQLDCSLVEINPLVVTEAGEIVALDGKISFDDNAMFRHKDLVELRDLSEEDPAEVRASNTGLSYVKLDGSIGCLVNGAGLAMATMDIIKLHGGEPANFLDVGGGANEQQVTEAFRIILSDPHVKAVLVNIFGGIARCSTIASAIVAASKAVGFNVPLVVRLEGTEVEEGKKILRESGVKLTTADDLTDAAKKVVAAVK